MDAIFVGIKYVEKCKSKKKIILKNFFSKKQCFFFLICNFHLKKLILGTSNHHNSKERLSKHRVQWFKNFFRSISLYSESLNFDVEKCPFRRWWVNQRYPFSPGELAHIYACIKNRACVQFYSSKSKYEVHIAKP